MSKPLAELTEQEAAVSFQQHFSLLLRQYEAAGFKVSIHVDIGPPYLLTLLSGLQFPLDQITTSQTFIIQKGDNDPSQHQS